MRRGEKVRDFFHDVYYQLIRPKTERTAARFLHFFVEPIQETKDHRKKLKENKKEEKKQPAFHK